MIVSRPRLLPVLAVVLVALATGGIAWHLSWGAVLRLVAERADADLSQTSDRLIAQVRSYRELAVLLADHPEVVALLSPGFTARDDMAADAARAQADQLLLRKADTVGALRIAALDTDGALVSGSEPRLNAAVLSLWKPAVTRALNGALGRFSGHDAQADRRSMGFGAPVFGVPYAPPTGALVVAADLEALEAEWRADPTAVFFTTPDGAILLSNRSELVSAASPFADVTARQMGMHTLWRIGDGGRYLPKLALHLSRDLPVIGLRGTVLVDAGPARRVALLQALLAGGTAAALGVLGLWGLSRRDAMTRKLAEEARAKELLEARVVERTAELQTANEALRREVAERKEAEARLKSAQDRLVQAGKLSALGEMSAGISHELNQPLMAIRSFAENAALLLEQGRTDVVAQNLGRISDLGNRMGRIIRNLRAFARQDDAPVRPIDPVPVIEAVLEMMDGRLRRDAVEVDWQAPRTPLRVMAGEVRLQQVVMNLVSNALDAMEATPVRRLRLAVEEGSGSVRIVVADCGPGIAVPDRIFDPFYTTKEVGPTEGMGLGLSISYGLVQSFGGEIEGRNADDGGAVFTVTLPRVVTEVAA